MLNYIESEKQHIEKYLTLTHIIKNKLFEDKKNPAKQCIHGF